MPAPLTIIIPTHNRHNYLWRTIQYYQGCKYPVLILDSSTVSFDIIEQSSIKYVHLANMHLPDKLHYGFTNAETEFVIMCADDDFLVIDGVDECLRFLQRNREYAVADGGILFYKKKDIFKREINFNLLYKTGLDLSFDTTDALIRLKDFFKNYRTVFYGLHYTRNLQYIYGKCRSSFNNLYLNEYLTALYPVVAGYSKIIPVLTAIRESTDVSGDKTIANLDSMFGSVNGEAELHTYINCVAQAIHSQTGIELLDCISTITQGLQQHAETISISKQKEQKQYQSFTKKAGSILYKIPVVGAAIVRKSRSKASKKEISVLIRTQADRHNLQKVERLIQQFQSIL